MSREITIDISHLPFHYISWNKVLLLLLLLLLLLSSEMKEIIALRLGNILQKTCR